MESMGGCLACVASVSVRFSARSRHFSFFSRAKIGASPPVTHFLALAPIFARLKNEKCLERAENLTETLATQASGCLKKRNSVVLSRKYSMGLVPLNS